MHDGKTRIKWLTSRGGMTDLAGCASSAYFWPRSSLPAGGQDLEGGSRIGGHSGELLRDKSVTDGMLRDGE